MAITYVAGTNTLTLDGINTYTLLDIYNADVAGAWGVVTHVGEMYLLLCHMVVGDAGGNATKLVDSNVGFQLGVTGTRKNFESKAGSSFEMTGCILKFWSLARKTSYGTWKFKNCSVYQRESTSICLYMRGNQDHERSEFDAVYWYNRDGTCSYNKCLVKVSSTFYYYTSGIIDDLTITGNFTCYFNTPTLKNTTISGNISVQADCPNCILINSTWGGSLTIAAAAGYLHDKWEFDLTVTDEANAVIVGATVTLKDKDGVTRHTGTTDVNGQVGTWEVLANQYLGTSETKTEYTPFTLTVSKVDTNYLTYIKKFDLAEKINWKIAMVDMSDLIEDLDDIKGTGFVKDTHSLVDLEAYVDGIETKTNNLPTDPADQSLVEAKIDAAITEIDANETKLDTAITNIATLDGKIVVVDNEIAIIDTEVGVINSKVDTIDTVADEINATTKKRRGTLP